MKTALVTGATGFIGSRLALKLVELKWNVHVIIRKNSDLKELEAIQHKITFHYYDNSTESLIEIVRLSKPNIVFHIASLFIARHKADQVSNLIDSNLKFPTQLLEAMAVNKIEYFINTGTSWEYYEGEEYNPVCLYAATKHAFESLIEYYVQAHDLRVITLRLFDTYGPKDPRKKIIALLNRITHSNESFPMSLGEQEIDLVYIDDVVNAYLLAASRIINMDESCQISYDISSLKPVTLKVLVCEFEKIMGKRLNIDWGKLPYRDREVMKSNRVLSVLPGWSASVKLNDGLKKIISLGHN